MYQSAYMQNLMKMLIFISLFVLLVGCGKDSSSTSSTQPTSVASSGMTPSNPTSISSPPTSSSPTPTLSPSADNTSGNPYPAIPLNEGPTSVDIPNLLHIESVGGFQCPLGRNSPVGTQQLTPPSNFLVLATDRLSYNDDEIQQMRDYLHAMYQNMASMRTSYLVSPPTTLSWVMGGLDCRIEFQITNISPSSTIQIASLGVQLTSTPQPNNYQYHAIDACTVLDPSDAQRVCPQLYSLDTSCIYNVGINLNGGQAKDVLTDTPTVAFDPLHQCNGTIDQNATVTFAISLHASISQIYYVMPVLILVDSSGTSTSHTLTQWSDTLAFTNGNQITCYGLQGNTFSQETQTSTSSGQLKLCV